MKGKKSSTRVRRKTWYKITAPKLFNNQVLGESCVFDQRQLLNRKLKVNLMNLIGDPKKQHINIDFKIVELQGDKVKTDIVGYSMSNSAIKRFVRRGITRIDETIICETSDNKKLKIKPFLLTRTKVKSLKETILRKLLIDTLVVSVNKMAYDQFFESLISYKLQKSMRQVLNKITPLRSCEIRNISIPSEKEAAKRMIKPKKQEQKYEGKTEKEAGDTNAKTSDKQE